MRDVWNNLRGLQATAGTFASVYHPGAPNEWVTVIKPDGATQNVRTPALLDWFLAAEDGVVVIYYHRDDGGGNKSLVRVPSGIACGVAVGALTSGGTGQIGPAGPPGPRGERGDRGPQGPAGVPGGGAEVDDATIDRIAAAVANYPAAPDHFGILPAEARSGLWLQDAITVLLSNQAVAQVFIKALDEAALNLLASGYQPKVPQGG